MTKSCHKRYLLTFYSSLELCTCSSTYISCILQGADDFQEFFCQIKSKQINNQVASYNIQFDEFFVTSKEIQVVAWQRRGSILFNQLNYEFFRQIRCKSSCSIQFHEFCFMVWFFHENNSLRKEFYGKIHFMTYFSIDSQSHIFDKIFLVHKKFHKQTCFHNPHCFANDFTEKCKKNGDCKFL